MSMSTHVIGFKPADEKWKQMKSVYDACTAAKIRVPEEVAAFFGYETPSENGVQVEIPHREYHADMQEGVEIEIDKIPKDVKIIRFFNSY